MSHAVFVELEELRRMLETPQQPSNHGSDAAKHAPSGNAARAPLAAGMDVATPYSTVLKGAENGVTRLSRAIEAADDEMDAALKRTEEAHRQAGERREVEIAELRRVVAAKERCIDGLRDELSAAKRGFESRIDQLEEALAQRDHELVLRSQEAAATREEMGVWGEELEAWREERQAIKAANAQLTQQAEALVREHAAAEEDLQCALRQSHNTIKALRKEKEEMMSACMELKRQALLANEEAKAESGSNARLAESVRTQNDEIEHLLATVEVLKNKLRAERKVRKSSEKWLRAELKSREDMETLFATVRNIALNSDASDDAADRVKDLIDGLRMDRAITERIASLGRARRCDGAKAGGAIPPSGANGRLGGPGMFSSDIKAQLASAKRLLSEEFRRHDHKMRPAR